MKKKKFVLSTLPGWSCRLFSIFIWRWGRRYNIFILVGTRNHGWSRRSCSALKWGRSCLFPTVLVDTGNHYWSRWSYSTPRWGRRCLVPIVNGNTVLVDTGNNDWSSRSCSTTRWGRRRCCSFLSDNGNAAWSLSSSSWRYGFLAVCGRTKRTKIWWKLHVESEIKYVITLNPFVQ
jgi:hypothetical protein